MVHFRGRWSKKDLKGRLVAASFSHDGEWLFVWESDKARYYWFIWDVSAGKIRDHGRYSQDVFLLE